MQVPPFNKFMGMELVRKEGGVCEVALELQPHHCNRRGVAHGGVVSTLLDTSLGGAVVSSIPKEWWCATISLNVQFISGGKGRLTSRGEVTRRGKSVAFARGVVLDASERLVASAEGSWHLWQNKPGVMAPPPRDHVVLRGSGERVAVGKIVAVGRNYAAHAEEMNAQVGEEPVLFEKPSTALAHDGDTLYLPRDRGATHHEVELVALIGKRCRKVSPEEAAAAVAGYAVGLDLTLREMQSGFKKRGEPWFLAKGFDQSAPVSVVAPAAEVGDGSGLAISLAVNGETRQQDNTSSMVRSVADLVAFISQLVTLEPGDLVMTGTPAGVGPVDAGDRLEATIEKVGSLNLRVAE